MSCDKRCQLYFWRSTYFKKAAIFLTLIIFYKIYLSQQGQFQFDGGKQHFQPAVSAQQPLYDNSQPNFMDNSGTKVEIY